MTATPTKASSNLLLVLSAHWAFRRDLASLARIAEHPDPLDDEHAQRVKRGWVLFADELRRHHEGEDTSLWPRVRVYCGDHPEALAVLQDREDDHRRLDDLVTRAQRQLDTTSDLRAALSSALPQLADELRTHLDHEELDALPLADRLLSPADWRDIAAEQRDAIGPTAATVFFPWLLDGLDRSRRDELLAILPPPLRALVMNEWEPAYRSRYGWLIEP